MIIAITMVKNEEDIIGYTLDNLQNQGVDHVYCYDNLSTDNTPQILGSYNQWVTILPDPEYGYYQSRKMNYLAQLAYTAGAEWVIPFDADEHISHPDTIKTFLRSQPDNIGIIRIKCWDYLPRKDDSDEPNPYLRHRYRRLNPQPYPKIVFRATKEPSVHMGNHGVDHVSGETVDGLTLRHIQYRSASQMAQKLRNGKAVYDATDLDHGQGAHWRQGGDLTDNEYAQKWVELCEEPAEYDPLL